MYVSRRLFLKQKMAYLTARGSFCDINKLFVAMTVAYYSLGHFS